MKLTPPTACPICGRAYEEQHINAFDGYDYIHGRYPSFTDMCQESAKSAEMRERKERQEREDDETP